MDRRILPPQVLPGLGKRGTRAPLPPILKTLRYVCTPRGMYHLPERADDPDARQLTGWRRAKLTGRDGKNMHSPFAL